MHGIFHVELQHFIESNYGPDVWRAAKKQAGLEDRFYMTVSLYLDSEAFAIAEVVSELTGASKAHLFEDFGKFIAPHLLGMCTSLIDPSWRTAEMLLNTEDIIHKVVRMKNPGAAPPQLKFRRIGDNELLFYYNSPRQMSSVARGIMKGIADHYGETLTIQEQKHPDGSIDMRILIS